MSKLPRLFFVGVGNMGNPMAANLLRAGYPLSVYDVCEEKAANLVELGAQWVPSLAQGAAKADVVISSLPGPVQVKEVMLGEQGLLALLDSGTTIIDTSTSAVELVQGLVELASARKIEFLEAPITNAIDAAQAGTLTIFVGGSLECFGKHRAIFDVIGEKILFVGKPGNGATTKLLTNHLWFVSAAAVGEGLMLGAKAGIPLETVWEALKSSAGDSWVVQHDVPSIFSGSYDPSFSLALCCKDLGLIREIAKKQGIELPMGNMAQKLFEEAKETYGPEAAELHVVRLLEEKSGLLLRPPNGTPITDEAQ